MVYTDEKLGWGSLVKNLTIIDVDGGHSTILQEPFVGAVAAALMRYINDSASTYRTSKLNTFLPDAVVDENLRDEVVDQRLVRGERLGPMP
jgi:hypothetical protein